MPCDDFVRSFTVLLLLGVFFWASLSKVIMKSADQKTRVLIVEDDDSLGYFLARFLECEQYEVALTRTGQDGLTKAMKQDYDLFLIDLGLPELSGLSLIKRIRRKYSDTPIIVITNQMKVEVEVECFSAGVNLYHRKPVNYELLLVQIRSFEKDTEEDCIMELKDLYIEPKKRYVKRNGSVVPLTKSEFDFLVLLASSNGTVFSRDTIAEKVLSAKEAVEPGAIDTLVSRVRKKLGEYGKEDVIQTVYRSGYRMSLSYFDE